jgi:hypothetical protein
MASVFTVAFYRPGFPNPLDNIAKCALRVKTKP